MLDAEDDELVYEITFDLPDAGLAPTDGNFAIILCEDRNDNTAVVIAEDTEDTPTDGRSYPTRACRSAVGNQPYDAYAPRTTFLQLGTVRVHRSVLEANRLARMTKEEQLLATTTATSETFVDDVRIGWIKPCARHRRKN